MFGDSIRDMIMLLFNLICSVVVISFGILSFKTVRTYGLTVTSRVVDERALENEYKYSGIDDKVFTRDEAVAIIMNNLSTKDFEISVRNTANETRAQVEADKRVFNREKYIAKTTDYTAEALKERLTSGSTYKAYLVYKGVDTTTVNSAHTAKTRGDYVTGIAFIKQ